MRCRFCLFRPVSRKKDKRKQISRERKVYNKSLIKTVLYRIKRYKGRCGYGRKIGGEVCVCGGLFVVESAREISDGRTGVCLRLAGDGGRRAPVRDGTDDRARVHARSVRDSCRAAVRSYGVCGDRRLPPDNFRRYRRRGVRCGVGTTQ